MSRISIHFLVLISGLAALSWEVLWQVKSGLALGVSAWGTALTLAVTMGGMSAGALLAGRILRDKTIVRPARIYAILEVLIGISGLLLVPAFALVEQIDTWAYTAMPENGMAVHLLGIAAVIGIPALCMGATLPVLGLTARQFGSSIATLYGLNTLGAAAGALAAAFLLIPYLGITHASWFIAIVNLAVAGAAWSINSGKNLSAARAETASPAHIIKSASLIVFATGFATFALEVAWFRSLTAAFRSTTDAFAIMLASVLIALGVGARLVPFLKSRNAPLHIIVGWAGILILLVTPIIERFDLFTATYSDHPALLVLNWFIMTLYVIGIPVLFLGMALPWILDDERTTGRWGRLYALNAFAAIIGSLGAGWVMLPLFGFAFTAWIAGFFVCIAGVVASPQDKRAFIMASGILALLIAINFQTGVGNVRVLGWDKEGNKPEKILQYYEGPESSVAAVEYENGIRSIIIDGFTAAQQSGGVDDVALVHYMAWMGHLPMLLTPDPKNALVICFGTGQTANAVRKENPETLDIVDINPRVLRLADNFPANEAVLDDPRVHATVMDGRAYLRRTDKIYDVITLEPMPPNFAGVNALYSKEFYKFARARLSQKGVIAQWVPFHILGAKYSASIAATFRSVFPNAILWMDPPSHTGILLGSPDDAADLGKSWPGFARTHTRRDLSKEEVRKAVVLDSEALEKYAAKGKIITDDNQLLAYGDAVYQWHRYEYLEDENFEMIKNVLKED